MIMVLIVAKCNVNLHHLNFSCSKSRVLIVAKCNVNIDSIFSFFEPYFSINSSKV